jgi:two-component system sensor histidine kinase PilS (NtrC family)
MLLVATGLASDRPDPVVPSIALAYALAALAVWLLPRPRALVDAIATPAGPGRSRLQWLATIGIDLLAFVALHLLERGSGFNFAALLMLPVLMAGVLMPRLLALGIAAAATLLLLVVAWEAGRTSGDATIGLARAGLAGIGFFATALVAGELAQWLLRGEAAARDSLELARRQAQLNRLVIQEMGDGVLVVDRALRVRAANPAARALLVGREPQPEVPFDLGARTAWAALAAAAARAWPAEGREIGIALADGRTRRLRLRVRLTRGGGSDDPALPADPYGVLLLEDVRTLEARVRQEKLAAMGRMSAGIAHEIRNPLAAISQANALLLEETLPPAQQQLARIVADNVRRLQRIADEVTALAPGHAETPPVIDAAAIVADAVVDWARTAALSLGPGSRLATELPPQPLRVRFDPDHLRRVLVNLLDNAARHASHAPAAMRVRLVRRNDRRIELQVASDGATIAPEVERHLFEPFFSTRSRGSGLGLYICRELCERYRARIDYLQHPPPERLHNEFVVVMEPAA